MADIFPTQDDGNEDRKRIKINTALDAVEKGQQGDPLLLVAVNTKEWISRPFQYDVTMWRPVAKGRISPPDMINTWARVGVKVVLNEFREELVFDDKNQHAPEPKFTLVKSAVSYVLRGGVFESFHDDGQVNETFLQYTGTIVPAFKMLNFETCFRVFEKKTVREIIQSVTRNVPHLVVNDDALSQELADCFPELEACVQFGESSFNFVSRLMAQFGIWYFFDHDADFSRDASGNDTDLQRNSMVLGRTTHAFKPCRIAQGKVDFAVDKLTIQEGTRKPSILTIAEFDSYFLPQSRFVRAGNFNILNPTDLITGAERIQAARDLVEPVNSKIKTDRTLADDKDRFRSEVFPILAQKAGLGSKSEEARRSAESRMHAAEAAVITVTGKGRNPTFAPGYKFQITDKFPPDFDTDNSLVAGSPPDITVIHGDLFPPDPPDPSSKSDQGSYVLTYSECAGHEHAYDPKGSFLKSLLRAILPDFLFDDDKTIADFAANVTAQGLNNYLQNEFPYVLQNQLYAGTQYNLHHDPSWQGPNIPVTYFLPYTLGGGLAVLTTILPGIVKVIENQLKEGDNDFSNSFQSIRLDGPLAGLQALPGPIDGKKPVAYGPHLATVIGPNGAETVDKDNKPLNEVFADVLGRVRIRFPWQFPGEPDPYRNNENACWVRVSQAWAGTTLGWQFLPRIGEEVIVEFINGDPDRPIVTGRVYNADRGFTNLPFPDPDRDLKMVQPGDLLNATGSASDKYRFNGLKTFSTPKPTAKSPDRYHLLRFDDTYNCEQYLIRSQGRLDVTAFAHSFETTHGNRHVKVVQGEDDKKQKFGGSSLITVGGDYNLNIGGAFYGQAGKNYELTVKADTVLDLQGKLTAVVGKQLSLNAPNIVLEASEKLTLKVGGSSIVITPGNVYIFGTAGTHIDQLTGGPGAIDPAELKGVADAVNAEPGDTPHKRTTDCNPHSGHGGGKWQPRKANEHHGPVLTEPEAQQEFQDEELREGKFVAIPGKLFSGPTG